MTTRDASSSQSVPLQQEIVRTRLLSRFAQGSSLMVVEAAPGTGKSTFMAQWAAAAAGPAGIGLVVDLEVVALSAAVIANRVAAAAESAGVTVDPRLLVDDPVAAVTAALPDTETSSIALVRTDGIDPSVLAEWCDRWSRERPTVRLAVSCEDALDLRRELDRREVAHRVVGDLDLRFDADEIARLAASIAPGLSERAVADFAKVTAGHPALTAYGLTDPDLLAGSPLTVEHVMRAVRTHDSGRSPFRSMLMRLAQARRFPVAAVPQLCGGEDGIERFERMVAQGYGEVDRTGPVDDYVWDPDVRAKVLDFAVSSLSEAQLREDRRRVAEVLGYHGRFHAQLTSLLEAGDLAAAEDLAADRFWELIADDPHEDLDALRVIPRARLGRHATLTSLRLDVIRRRAPLRADVLAASARVDRTTDRTADPRERMHRLVLGAYVASTVGDLARAQNLVLRWSDLDDLTRHRNEPDPMAVSDALVVLQVLVALDLLDHLAERIARVVDQLGDDLHGTVDPHGRRRAHLRLLAAATGRTVGDPVAMRDTGIEVAADPGREFDRVLLALLRGWECLDTASPGAARLLLNQAVEQVRDRLDWPLLLTLRLLALVADGDEVVLRREVTGLVRDQRWRARQFAVERRGPLALIIDGIAGSTLGIRPAPSQMVDDHDPLVWSGLTSLADFVGRASRGDVMDPRALRRPLENLQPRGQWLVSAIALAATLRREDRVAVRAALENTTHDGPGLSMTVALCALLSPADRALLDGVVETLPDPLRRTFTRHLAQVRSFGVGVRKVVLSDREGELLSLMRDGLTNRQVADRWGVSVNTVKFHRANLYRKLEATDRQAALAAATRHGL